MMARGFVVPSDEGKGKRALLKRQMDAKRLYNAHVLGQG
jgi:hypothetical protein